MPNRLFDEIKNWAGGVNTSAAADRLPVEFFPRGKNSAFFNIGAQNALIGSRLGALTLNATPVTGSAGIIGGIQFKRSNGTKQNLLVSDTGRLDLLNADNTLSTINATAFTSGVHYPVFAVAKDLLFIVNDVDQKKFDGTTVARIGIVRPAAPTAAAAAGGAMAAGVWDVGLTYYNSATGHESSLSDFTSVTLGGANLKINVSWPAPSDAQVTHVRVYIRQQTAGANAYRAIAGATPAADVTHGGYVPATTATVLDISATQFGAFILLAPSIYENEPPAVGLKYPCWHDSRLFLADSGNIYYSKIKDGTPYPEAFDPRTNVQPVNPQDGDSIIALISAHGKLYVVKTLSLWAIEGTDPNSWDVRQVSRNYGGSNARSFAEVEGKLYWWAGSNGPVAMGPDEQIIPLGKELLNETIAADVLNHLGFASAVVGIDEAQQTILFAVPEFGATRNTRVIPFNYRIGRFCADSWNPFDVYSMWRVETTDKLATLYMGGYSGQTFQWWAAQNDGVPSGTAAGTVTSATSTTLTDSTASFVTTGGKLIERYVYAVSADRQSIQRRRITANTGTQLTVSSAWDTTPNATYTYVIGGIDWQVDTSWQLGPSTFLKKRFEFLFIEALSSSNGALLDVDLFTDLDEETVKKTKQFSVSSAGGSYDALTSIYDTTHYATSGSSTFSKLRCARVGKSWRARIRALQSNVSVVLRNVTMQSIGMSLKR